jgi:hypothetical protein
VTGELSLGDFHAVHRGYGVARGPELGIGLYSPGGEGDRDQPEEDLDDALILGNEIEHGSAVAEEPEFYRLV